MWTFSYLTSSQRLSTPYFLSLAKILKQMRSHFSYSVNSKRKQNIAIFCEKNSTNKWKTKHIQHTQTPKKSERKRRENWNCEMTKAELWEEIHNCLGNGYNFRLISKSHIPCESYCYNISIISTIYGYVGNSALKHRPTICAWNDNLASFRLCLLSISTLTLWNLILSIFMSYVRFHAL